MKYLASVFFLLLFSQINAQDSNKGFIIKSASIQKTYPGIPNADHTSKDQWVIKLEGPANVNARLNFLIEGYSISLPDLVTNAVVIGADVSKYTLVVNLTYPLDKYYTVKKESSGKTPELEIIGDGFEETLKLENIEMLIPISHP